MSVTCYIGDEVSAAGFRLAGARVIVPSAGDETRALASARESAAAHSDRRRCRDPYCDARSRVRPGGACTAHADHPGSQGGDTPGRSRDTTSPATRTRGCAMTLESRTQALLDLVEADRKRRCDAIIGDARARAAETIAAAHAEARGRMRETFEEERTRSETRVAAAQARLATHRRLHEQRRAGDLLAAGWRKLPAALCDRWREPEMRRSWVASVIAEAHRLLPPGAWRIAYASEMAGRRAARACHYADDSVGQAAGIRRRRRRPRGTQGFRRRQCHRRHACRAYRRSCRDRRPAAAGARR